MIGAGKRDRLITIERATVVTDEMGGEVLTWALHCTEKASVRHGTPSEGRDAAQKQASIAATFEVLSNAATRSIKTTDRLIFDGVTWDIHGAPLSPNRATVVISATQSG